MPGMNSGKARDFFPRGLFQPGGSFRFSLDALLLASFLAPARRGRGERLLDLGAGCGVVALGMLCLHPELEAVGLDIQPELTEAARVNAARLGFADRFAALCGDVADAEALDGRAGSFSLVLANPPYRRRESGRTPPSLMRRIALFEEEGGLAAFCRAAERAMTRNGRFGLIFPARRREDLLSSLDQAKLTPVRLLPVHARAADPAMLLLTEAVKKSPLPDRENSGRGPGPEHGELVRDAPLALHEKRGANVVFTRRALEFCPFLLCDADKKSPRSAEKPRRPGA